MEETNHKIYCNILIQIFLLMCIHEILKYKYDVSCIKISQYISCYFGAIWISHKLSSWFIGKASFGIETKVYYTIDAYTSIKIIHPRTEVINCRFVQNTFLQPPIIPPQTSVPWDWKTATEREEIFLKQPKYTHRLGRRILQHMLKVLIY